MKTNLIQSYLNGNPVVAQYNSDNAKKNFDIHKELTYRTFIKPLPSNGELVRNNIFETPSEWFKNVKYNIKAFKHSLSGNTNDHELGSLNDAGMKLGGLSIATYLFSRKSVTSAKIMEFIGLTSFFAAMDIWPKMALQLPAYLVHGFDIRQKYRDNYGTKKPVFQDHQFIPWDLYSDEEIYKIGDKMGVPKEMKNRRDFIQEKMRKIALQNNTLWMLTAGFATPIMSALICSAAEAPLRNYIDNVHLEKARMLLENFDKEIDKIQYPQLTKELNNILQDNKNKEITPKLINKITTNLSNGIDSLSAEAVKSDLNEILSVNSGFNINDKTIKDIKEFLYKKFSVKGMTEQDLMRIIPTEEVIKNKFKEFNLGNSNIKDFSSYINAISDIMDWNINSFIHDNPEHISNSGLEFVLNDILASENSFKEPEIIKIFKQNNSSILDENMIEKLRKISKSINDFKAKNFVLDKYIYSMAAQAPETFLANIWNDIAGDGILKTFKITDKEIEKTGFDRKNVGKLLRNKIEQIVSDDIKYNEVISTFEEQLTRLRSKTEFLRENVYKDKVNTIFNNTKNELQNLGMDKLAQHIGGYYDSDTRSLKGVQLSYPADRVKGVESSFYRILNTLDVFRRINKGEILKGINMSSVKKNEVIELCKQLLIEGHTSDYAVKFYFPRQIGQGAGLVDLPYDKQFYESVMNLLYKENLDDKTKSCFNQTSDLYENFLEYRKNLFEHFGFDMYFHKPNIRLGEPLWNSNSETKFLLMGSAPDEIFTKIFNNHHNKNKWLKMFGGLGLGLFTVTVLSQFFMGKMNSERKIQA